MNELDEMSRKVRVAVGWMDETKREAAMDLLLKHYGKQRLLPFVLELPIHNQRSWFAHMGLPLPDRGSEEKPR